MGLDSGKHAPKRPSLRLVSRPPKLPAPPAVVSLQFTEVLIDTFADPSTATAAKTFQRMFPSNFVCELLVFDANYLCPVCVLFSLLMVRPSSAAARRDTWAQRPQTSPRQFPQTHGSCLHSDCRVAQGTPLMWLLLPTHTRSQSPPTRPE